MKLRRLLAISFTMILIALLSGCAPDAVDSNGKPIRMSDYRGKWVVIHYWATWCSPCIQEIPDLIKLAKYYKSKVVVLGVNVDQLSNPVLNNLAQGYQVNYPFLQQFPIEKWGGKPEKLPVTYIFDRSGRLFATLLGPQKLQNLQTTMNLPDITYD